MVTNVIYDHVGSVLYCLKRCGCRIKNYSGNVIALESSGNLAALDLVRTSPYPGFPTDMQPQLVALLSKCKGTSVVVETVFENRFRYTEQLMLRRISAYRAGQQLYAGLISSGAPSLKPGLRRRRAGHRRAGGRYPAYRASVHDRGYERMEKVLAGVGATLNGLKLSCYFPVSGYNMHKGDGAHEPRKKRKRLTKHC